MEYDPGHAAFSYPSRPCKLDRSISWAGTTKSPNPYSSITDFNYDYGRHSQTVEFFDVPSMFEDALRQFNTSPCFAYPLDTFQTNIPLPPYPAVQNAMAQTELLHTDDLKIDSVELDVNNSENFWDTTLPLDTQQDFSSHLWSTSIPGNEIFSNTHLDPLGEPSDQIVPSSIGQLDPHLAMATLETIDEEIGCTIQTLECQEISHVHPNGSVWSESYQSQNLSLNLFHAVGDEFNADAALRQSLQAPSLGEPSNLSGTKRDPSVDKSTFVLVKVDVEVLASGGGGAPIHAPPPLSNLMSEFDSNPASPLPKRKRKCYTEPGKTKVKQVRTSGACIICKARKVPVSPLPTLC